MGWFNRKKKICISTEDQKILDDAKRKIEYDKNSKIKEVLNGAIDMICHKAELEFIHNRKQPFDVGDKVYFNLYTSKYNSWWGNPRQYKFIRDSDVKLEVIEIKADTSRLRHELEDKFNIYWWDKEYFSTFLSSDDLKVCVNITYDNMIRSMIKYNIKDTTEWTIKLNNPIKYHITSDYFVKVGSDTHKIIKKLEKNKAKLTKIKENIKSLEEKLKS
jgi:hypothetical protein